MNDHQVKEIPVNNIDKGIYIVKVTLKNGEQYFTKIAVIK
jgi:hypothetical protein